MDFSDFSDFLGTFVLFPVSIWGWGEREVRGWCPIVQSLTQSNQIDPKKPHRIRFTEFPQIFGFRVHFVSVSIARLVPSPIPLSLPALGDHW